MTPAPDSPESRPAWSWLLAPVVGLFAFVLSCGFVAPLPTARAMGEDFAKMAMDPFAWQGPFPHRVLGPLLAWLVGAGGERYGWFAHAMMVVFLSLVCVVALRSGCRLAAAALLTCVVAVTGAVEVYKESVGYAEPITFACLLGSLLLLRQRAAFWALQCLSLLNHEGIVFFWPWLLWQKAHAARLGRGDGLGALVAVGVYLAIRWSILAAAPAPTLTANVYFNALPGAAAAGTWALAAVAIVIYFGVLPLLLAWHAWSHGARAAGVPILLVLGGVFAMCTFATDFPRFIGFVALPVVGAGIHLLQRPQGWRWLLAAGVATAVAVVLQRQVVGVLFEATMRHLPQPVPAVVIELWPLFVTYGVVIAAMVAAGRWAARRGVVHPR